MKLNLGSGKVLLPKELGWINVDKFPMDGVDEVRDLFRFPWDYWSDNTVDEFYMSHIVEHIPHESKPPRGIDGDTWDNPRWLQLRDYDGWFFWFAEVWRIAQPGAKIRIVCPYALSNGAIQDPTHTRYLTGTSFAYLTAETQRAEKWDYHLPYLYTITSCRISIAPPDDAILDQLFHPAMKQSQLDALVMTNFNVGRDMYVELEVIK